MFVKRNLARPKWELMTALVWRIYEPIFHLVIGKEITILGRVLGDVNGCVIVGPIVLTTSWVVDVDIVKQAKPGKVCSASREILDDI